jgi:hypothetical protein
MELELSLYQSKRPGEVESTLRFDNAKLRHMLAGVNAELSDLQLRHDSEGLAYQLQIEAKNSVVTSLQVSTRRLSGHPSARVFDCARWV